MTLTVDQPILNSPFREPARYWMYEKSLPIVAPGRRSAGYYYRDPRRTPNAQLALLGDEHFVELPRINEIRKQVARWRADGYHGATPVTRRLLEYWQREGRERRLFFCQLEAAETIIWLSETEAGRRLAREIPSDAPSDPESIAKGYGPLHRFGAKMATGSGKTVVMAMVIAWSVLNKAQARQSRRYSDAILVVCPNLTVKERLGGAPRELEVEGIEQEPARPLIPGARGNYYEAFDLVPPALLDQLGRARVLITNWHVFLPEDDGRRRGVVQRGPESDAALCARTLRDLGSRGNLLVINDEAHHAYRPASLEEEDDALQGRPAEEQRSIRQEKEEATVWVSGLDRINAARSINFCLDLSATPFYLHGSGHDEGEPFPWLVSDFGLVDAIESGIVKIPRVPVADDTGRPEAKYFRLWQTIMDSLSPKERGTARRKPKPEAVLREAEGALQQLAGAWQTTYDAFQRGEYPVPPCFIVVCDNTDIAKLTFEYIGQEGRVFPELLRNEPSKEVTIRIDSKLLAEADLAEGSGGRAAAAERLRQVVATVGKPGEPGGAVRCVVSVAMLTEGWDAQNMTQILGLRAFQSQLLCEQVVGRGLRRLSYDFDLDEDGIPRNEEYVDVYGIPFEVIPVKKRPQSAPAAPRETTLVQALPERAAFAITFPRVEGYVFSVTDRIVCDVDAVSPLKIDSSVEPTEVIARAKVGYEVGAAGLAGPGFVVTQNRAAFYAAVRVQQVEYEIARQLTNALLSRTEFALRARHLLFPQALAITRAYLRRRVDYGSVDRREIGLEKYVQRVIERLAAAIRPGGGRDGAAKILPRIERFRPRGSTGDVMFRTTRGCRTTLKSHISHVVLDTATWEASATYHLEASRLVEAYARNDHLDLAIPYEFAGAQHDFLPDFVVRLTNGTHLLLETKGWEQEQDRAKYDAAKRWCEAVTNWGELGRWVFRDCRQPSQVPAILEEVVSSAQASAPLT